MHFLQIEQKSQNILQIIKTTCQKAAFRSMITKKEVSEDEKKARIFADTQRQFHLTVGVPFLFVRKGRKQYV